MVERKPKRYSISKRLPANWDERVRKSKKKIKVTVPLDTLPASVFTGRYRRNPYQQKWHNGRSQGLHRVVWEQRHGPVPKGMVIHHKNGNIKDNNLNNLGMRNRVDHSSMHGGDWVKAERITKV